jgi:D-Tyr-tRNAtyr deacylase
VIGLLQRVSAARVEVAGESVGAQMQVTLTNEGPVTFWLET